MAAETLTPTLDRVAATGFDPRRARLAVGGLAAAAVLLGVLFMTYDLRGSLSFALELRARRLGALVLVGAGLGYSAVLFHTVTNNRILTPSLVGFDQLYVLIQVSAAFFFGTFAFLGFDVRVRFVVEVLVMLAVAVAIHRWLFARHTSDLFLLVLVGIVLGTMFSGLTAMVSRMIDPNEYLTLQDRLFGSFAAVNSDLLGVSAVIIVAVVALSVPIWRSLDVVALGPQLALNLGVSHQRVVNRTMVCVAVLVSVATALVGPVTFLGLLVSNLAYRLTGTFRHRYTLVGASLLAVVALIGGQFVLEHVLGSTTRLSIIIGFVGGLYFLWLLVREARP